MTTNDEYYQESAVTTLRGIGHTYADALQRQGIINLFDLLLDLPFRYLDETFITEAGNAKPDGRHVLMFLEVVASRTINAGRTRLFLVKAKDDTGYVSAIFFNAYATFTNHFILGTRFTAFGVLKRDNNGQLCLHVMSLLTSPCSTDCSRFNFFKNGKSFQYHKMKYFGFHWILFLRGGFQALRTTRI